MAFAFAPSPLKEEFTRFFIGLSEAAKYDIIWTETGDVFVFSPNNIKSIR